MKIGLHLNLIESKLALISILCPEFEPDEIKETLDGLKPSLQHIMDNDLEKSPEMDSIDALRDLKKKCDAILTELLTQKSSESKSHFTEDDAQAFAAYLGTLPQNSLFAIQLLQDILAGQQISTDTYAYLSLNPLSDGITELYLKTLTDPQDSNAGMRQSLLQSIAAVTSNPPSLPSITTESFEREKTELRNAIFSKRLLKKFNDITKLDLQTNNHGPQTIIESLQRLIFETNQQIVALEQKPEFKSISALLKQLVDRQGVFHKLGSIFTRLEQQPSMSRSSSTPAIPVSPRTQKNTTDSTTSSTDTQPLTPGRGTPPSTPKANDFSPPNNSPRNPNTPRSAGLLDSPRRASSPRPTNRSRTTDKPKFPRDFNSYFNIFAKVAESNRGVHVPAARTSDLYATTLYRSDKTMLTKELDEQLEALKKHGIKQTFTGNNKASFCAYLESLSLYQLQILLEDAQALQTSAIDTAITAINQEKNADKKMTLITEFLGKKYELNTEQTRDWEPNLRWLETITFMQRIVDEPNFKQQTQLIKEFGDKYSLPSLLPGKLQNQWHDLREELKRQYAKRTTGQNQEAASIKPTSSTSRPAAGIPPLNFLNGGLNRSASSPTIPTGTTPSSNQPSPS